MSKKLPQNTVLGNEKYDPMIWRCPQQNKSSITKFPMLDNTEIATLEFVKLSKMDPKLYFGIVHPFWKT